MRIRLQLLANQNGRSNGCYQSLACAPGSGYENGLAGIECLYRNLSSRLDEIPATDAGISPRRDGSGII